MRVQTVDEEILAALARREAAAFERLVMLYQDRLHNFALRYLGSAPDAEEVTQDAFVKAHRAIFQRLTPERVANLALTPWLYRICLNAARNHVRRRRLPVVSLNGAELEGEAPLDPSAPVAEEPESLAERAGLRSAILSELLRLPDRYRAPVVLRLVEGFSYAEVAETLGQPVGTAKSNVHRGMLLMRPGLVPWWRGAKAGEEDHAL
jgi:RNA polymerase sigma-70 factor, ECF subfamily